MSAPTLTSVGKLNLQTNEVNYGKWLPAIENPDYTSRTITQNEIVIEPEQPNSDLAWANLKYAEIATILQTKGVGYTAWFSGNRSIHIHIRFSQDLSKEEKMCWVKENLPNYYEILDKGLIESTAHMIQAENKPHPRTGKPKILVETFGQAFNEFSITKIIIPIPSTINQIGIEKTARQILAEENPQEKDRVSCVMKLYESGLRNENELLQFIDTHCKWSDYKPEKTREKTLGILRAYATKQNPNKRTAQQEKDFYEQVHSIASFEAISKKVVADLGIYYDENQLWWLWYESEKAWKTVDEIDILNLVDGALQFHNSTLESKVKGIILEGLKREGRKRKPIELDKDEIQFKDKIINLRTMVWKDSTKEFFAVNPIPWSVGVTEDTPIMDKLFNDWVGDKKYILYEALAFSMAQQYFIHRIICLTGSGRNGKSQFLAIMRRFLGQPNTTSTDLELLNESRFEAAKLYKKLVCFIGETNFATIKKTSMIKRLTGQDLIGVEFKGKKPFDMESYAKIFMATNSLPETLDKTEGFYRRWLIIDFPNKFSETINIVDTIPNEEYPNLVLKCIRLLGQLRQACSFTGEGNVEHRKRVYEEKANPISQFIKENYSKDVNADIPFFEFYEKLIAYIESKGYRILTKRAVSDILEQMGFDTAKKHPDGDQSRVWVVINGLKAKDTEDTEDTHTSLLFPIGEKE